jgi:hypothetical protein
VALMLFFAFWYAYSYYRSTGEPTATPTSTCTPTATSAAPAPGKITVNVYNATQRDGLAARTASEVRKRGFKVSTVSNDPLAKQVPGPAEVRFGKTGAAAAKVVLALVKGAKSVQDARVDGSVDLVLGEKFSALAAAPKPAATKPSPKPATTKPSPKPATTTTATTAKPRATTAATPTSDC